MSSENEMKVNEDESEQLSKVDIEDKNVYFTTLIENNIYIPPREMRGDLNDVIERKLKHRFEDRCIAEGYVKKGSIVLMERSMGKMMTTNFRGFVNFSVKYTAEICNPVRGNIVSAVIKNINKIGLMAESPPMSIIVIKEYHEDLTIFDDIAVGDVINIEVIDRKYKLNENVIQVVGKLVE